MPGDGDPRAKYALFTWTGKNWEYLKRAVEFDVAAEIQAYRRAKPPGWEDSVQELTAKGLIPQIIS
jgi:hypothetical protein